MIKILVIEFFPENSSQRQKRRSNWVALSNKYSSTLSIHIPEPLLNEKGQKMNGKMLDLDGKFFPISNYDLVFIHESDGDNYVDEAIAHNIPFICYGARPYNLKIDTIKKLQIEFLPLQLLTENINLFFDHIAKDKFISHKSFYKLTNYEIDLEAKIYLLHSCFTPNLAKAVLAENFPEELQSAKDRFWEIPIKQLNPIFQVDNESLLEFTVESLVQTLSKMQNYPSTEYIEMHLNLRNALLPTNDTSKER